MKMRLFLLAALTAFQFGCKKTPPAETPKAPAPPAPAPAPEGAEAPEGEGAGKGAPPEAPAPSSATGGAVTKNEKVTACPPSLTGTDNVDRTIPSECGTVSVTGDYAVDKATLTIEAGVTLSFAPGASLKVGEWNPSKLIVKGTAEKPVVFTTSGDKAAGDWRGVRLADQADRSVLEHLTIEFAGVESEGALWLGNVDGVKVTNCKFKQIKGIAIQTELAAELSVTGTTFEAVESAAIKTGLRGSAGIGTDNTFPKDATGVVQLLAGSYDKNLTWKNIGAPWLALGVLSYDSADGGQAAWTIEAGNTVRFSSEGEVQIGQWRPAGLTVAGTADAPVRFEPESSAEKGAWPGVDVYTKGTLTADHLTLAFAGAADGAGLSAWAGAKVTVRNTTFNQNTRGFWAESGTDLRAFENNKFDGTVPAIGSSIDLLGKLGGGNLYGADNRILIENGGLQKGDAVVWKYQNAVVEFTTGAGIDRDVTIEAGSRFAVADGQAFKVGEWEVATVTAKGAPGAGITFAGKEARAGAWGGIVLGSKARFELSYATLSDAGAEGAISALDGSTAKLDHVIGLRCEGPTVAWTCGAKVERTEVTATDGTPAAEKAPEGCP